MAQLNTKIVLRNDVSKNWNSQILLKGEVGFEFLETGKVKMKVGDGVKPWNELEYFGGETLLGDQNSIVIVDNKIAIKGFAEAAPGAQLVKDADGALAWIVPEVSEEELKKAITKLEEQVYTKEEIDNLVASVYHYKGSVENYADLPQNAAIGDVYNIVNADAANGIAAGDNVAWNGENWDKLAGAIDLSGYAEKAEVEKVSAEVEKVVAEVEKVAAEIQAKRFEIADTPKGTLVSMGEREIRIMCPADAEYHKQAVGVGGDSNTYYITLKTYAPNDEVVGYKETLNGQEDAEILMDLKVDEKGRKYQPTWLGIAVYDATTDSWNYYGKSSSTSRYIGWNYKIDWYNAEGLEIASDSVRINLSNEDCHDVIEPYYMASIDVNKLSQKEGDVLVLYGGSATDNI